MIGMLFHKSRWFIYHLIRDPVWAMRRLVGYSRPPLFIYQMGKVGSSSIKRTLETCYHICHFHTSQEFAVYKAKYPTRKHLAQESGKFDIVTATRDPIGREISAFFQNLTNPPHPYAVGTSKQDVLAIPVETLIRKFRQTWQEPNRLPDTTTWFDSHFIKSTGIDIYQHPFDKERGWQIISQQDWRVLILRFEDINNNFLEAINAFITERFGENAASNAMLQANLSEKKWYAQLMREFKKAISFTDDEIDGFYNSKYCRHFYTAEEIGAMKVKWQQR